MNRQREGFTLMEMLIVVAIIAVLSGVGYNYYADILPETREAAVRANLALVRDAISRYFKDNMKYPDSLDSSTMGLYLQTDSVQNLLISPLGPTAKLLVEVPDPLKTSEVNVFQVPPASCTLPWPAYDFSGGGSGGKQIRSIKIKLNDTEMPW